MEKIDQQKLINCMDELQYYNLIDIIKPKGKMVKDLLSRKFQLKVDLNELCHELDNHPQLNKREKKQKEKDQQKEAQKEEEEA